MANHFTQIDDFCKTSCLSGLSPREFYEFRKNNGVQIRALDIPDVPVFIEDQLYISVFEMLPIMMQPALSFLQSTHDNDRYYFATFEGSLIAFEINGGDSALYYSAEENVWKTCETSSAA